MDRVSKSGLLMIFSVAESNKVRDRGIIARSASSVKGGKSDKGNKNGWDRPEKCSAGIILLLDRLLERSESRLLRRLSRSPD